MLLNNLDKLDMILPPEHYKYLTVFRAFDAVGHSCFSYDLDRDYMRYIESFKAAWYDLGLPTTCKMHLLIEHLPEELARYGMGTALLSKHAGESLHADFDKHYQGFIVKDVDAIAYQKKLLQAVDCTMLTMFKNSSSSIIFQFEFDDC